MAQHSPQISADFDLDRTPSNSSRFLPIAFGCLAAAATASFLLNVFAVTWVSNHKILERRLKEASEVSAEAAKKLESAQSVAAAELAAEKDQRMKAEQVSEFNLLRVSELERERDVARSDARSISEASKEAARQPSELNRATEKLVLKRLSQFDIRAVLSDAASVPGLTTSLITERARAAGRDAKLAFTEQQPEAYLLVSVNVSKQPPMAMLRVQVVERWRMPNSNLSYPVSVAEVTSMTSWKTGQDLLGAIDVSVRQMARTINDSRGE